MKFKIFTKTSKPEKPMIGMYTTLGKIDAISGYNGRKFFRVGERSIEPENVIQLEFWIKDSQGEHKLDGSIEDLAFERGADGFIYTDEIEFKEDSKGVKFAVARTTKDNKKKKQTPLW